MPLKKTILALDIAKAKLDAYLRLPQPRTCTVPNTPAGHAKLLAWAVDAGALHVCLEATNTYGQAIAHYAHAAGHTVSILQPLAVKRYAQAMLARNKTDRLDAALIADFAHTQEPRAWTPPTAAQAILQAQSRLRAALIQQKLGWTCALATAHVAVQPTYRALLRSLQAQITKLDGQLATTLRTDPELDRQAKLLRSIPAVGPVLSAGLLAELPADLRDARAATAYAGLNPRQHESGSSVRGRTTMSKIGNAHLRRLLYVPAMAGIRFNPVLRAQAARLEAKGKPGKVRVGAVMRKLLCLCVGVLRSGQPWNPTGRPTPTATTPKQESPI